jgi:quercetin dioxygenase-like cupin family protein
MKKNKPKRVRWSKKAFSHFSILEGPPETCSMCSGLVSLKPGKTVGTHSTKQYEELIIILEGKGKVEVNGHKPFIVQSGVAVYNPPNTEHNVINTGRKILRYIYVVARVKK